MFDGQSLATTLASCRWSSRQGMGLCALVWQIRSQWLESVHRTHAPLVYGATTKSWWILHCWLTGDPLCDNYRALHRVSERSWIFFIWYEWLQIQNDPLFKSATKLWTWIHINNTIRLQSVCGAWAVIKPYLWRTANMSWRTCRR